MKTFNSYAEILAATKSQVSAQDLINGRLNIEPDGWQDIELTESLRDTLANDIANLLGGRNTTKRSVRSSIVYGRPQHWGLGRIFLEQYGNSEPRLAYCAGQDYPAEINLIRNAIK